MIHPPAEIPDVSIIVISKDRHDLLLKCVDSLKRQQAHDVNFEIIVVEEGHEPTPFEGVNYVFLPYQNKGLAFARNQGVTHAKGKIILFTDDDCLHKKDWLIQMLLPFDNPQIYGVVGATLAQKFNTIGDCEEILGFPGGGLKRVFSSGGKIIQTPNLSGCNCAYRREVFKKYQFDERIFGKLGADDFILGREVAHEHKTVFNPDAVVYHLPRGQFSKIIKWFQRRRYCELAIANTKGKLFNETFIPPWRNMILRVTCLMLLPVLFGLTGLILIAVLCMIYYLGFQIKYFRIIKLKGNYKALFILPIVKMFMDLGTLYGDLSFIVNRNWHGILNEYRR